MRFFAVAGSPVLHSKSPFLFTNFFQNSSIETAYGRVAADSAGEVIFIFNSFGFNGMNITTPFKNEIIPYLAEFDEKALLTGSVNTIVRWGDGIKGFNTDPAGAVKALEGRGVNLSRLRCVVVGAGGAGVAAAFGLLRKGAEVTVVNRTYEKAQKVAASLGCRAAESKFLRDILREADILVSAITAGDDFINRGWLKGGLIVLDANYKKPAVFHMAESKGCKTIKGEEWLYYQALEAFDIFAKSIAGGAGDKEQSETWKPETRAEFPLQVDLDEARRKKPNISLVGFMGSGKTSVGRELAEKMGFELFDSDKEIENNEGMEVKKIFEKRGEAYFRAKEKIVTKKLKKMKGTVFSCGGGALMDSENRQIIKEYSHVIFLYSTLETCLKRGKIDG